MRGLKAAGFDAVEVVDTKNVKGANLRLSTPYLDPKMYDGGAYESAKYAERRDDIGRLMLSVMMQAQRELTAKGTAAR